MLAIQSPRLMGEAAYYTGKGAGLLGDAATIPIEYLQKLGINPGLLGNAMSANERYQQ
jgi:hypothetical protein